MITGCMYSTESRHQTLGERWQTTDQRHTLNGHLGVVTRLKSRKRAHQHDGEIAVRDASAQRTPWQSGRHSNLLRAHVGRSRVNMLTWGFFNEPETCYCGIRQTMQHLVIYWSAPWCKCTACYTQHLTMANGIAIGCARHWEGTIGRTCVFWWKPASLLKTYLVLLLLRSIKNWVCLSSLVNSTDERAEPRSWDHPAPSHADHHADHLPPQGTTWPQASHPAAATEWTV